MLFKNLFKKLITKKKKNEKTDFSFWVSLVLLVVCYAKYTFTLTDIGSYGDNNDCGILAKFSIGKKFDKNKMNQPITENLVGFYSNPINYFLADDEIFPLKSWLLRPYPGNLTDSWKVFNYRFPRLRRTIEDIFGILASSWPRFHPTIRGRKCPKLQSCSNCFT